MIAGLLLAAGHSRRFGGDKLLAPLHGRPVIAWSASALAGAVERTWAVVPPDVPSMHTVLSSLGVQTVEHPGRDAGMGSSIAAGTAALPPEADAVIIALADQPMLSMAVAVALCDRWRATGAPVVVPNYRDGRGHPVLFGRASFPALLVLRHDEGARSVVGAAGTRIEQVLVDALQPLDVDTPDALAAVAALMTR